MIAGTSRSTLWISLAARPRTWPRNTAASIYLAWISFHVALALPQIPLYKSLLCIILDESLVQDEVLGDC